MVASFTPALSDASRLTINTVYINTRERNDDNTRRGIQLAFQRAVKIQVTVSLTRASS